MGFIKLKKNKTFNYKPRYYKGEGSPFELKHKFDAHRTTVNPAKGLKGKLNAALEDYKANPDDSVSRRVLIIIAVLVLVFLLIIGFDFSIFFSNN